MKIAIRLLIPPILILGLGWWVLGWLSEGEEKPKRSRDYRRAPPKVRVAKLERTDFKVIISSNGVVRAHNSTSLTPRVSGQVLRISEQFEDGAFFQSGDVLIELDPTDFDAALATAKARVARAEAVLAQEQARAEQARLDWTDLGNLGEPSDLVLRKPQLKEATASLTAAKADLEAANRDAERSEIAAPYAGCVRRRLVGPGQSVSPGTDLGEIFSTEFAEIRLPLTASDLSYFKLPEDAGESPISVSFYDSLDSTNTHCWKGTVIRTEGVLNANSRELHVISRVHDPYGLHGSDPPLRIGQPVHAKIEGKALQEVFVLPRKSLRNPTEVVLVDPKENTIKRTQITPIWEDKQHVIVRDDLPEGWLLIVSSLPYAADGDKVEIIENTPPAEDAEALNAGKSSTDASGSGSL